MSTTELNAAARDLLSVKAMIAELEQEAEALTDKLKEAMVDAGSEAMSGPGWTASWKNVVSSRFDSRKFKAENAAVYEAYTRPVTTCRFLIQSTI